MAVVIFFPFNLVSIQIPRGVVAVRQLGLQIGISLDVMTCINKIEIQFTKRRCTETVTISQSHILPPVDRDLRVERGNAGGALYFVLCVKRKPGLNCSPRTTVHSPEMKPA